MISGAVLRELWAQESAAGLAMLVTLSAPGWPDPLRFTGGPTVISGGAVYRPWPVDLTPPEFGPDGARPGRIRIHADPSVFERFRTAGGPIRVDIAFVYLTDPETQFVPWRGGRVVSPRLEGEDVVADVHWPAWAETALPRRSFTPPEWPGLFQ